MTNALERYQAKKTAMKAAWTPPMMADFKQDFWVMSFDQSLATTGWIYLRVVADRVDIAARGTLRTKEPEGLTGWRANFARARQIKHEMNGIQRTLTILDLDDKALRWPEAVVLELPNVHGHRTDSSMLAAHEIDQYCEKWWRPTDFISIQQSRTILGGSNIRNSKKDGHKALERYVPESIQRTWNEHQRDAAINALGHLYNLKQQEAADD